MSVRPLPSALAEKAKTELNEICNVLKDGIHQLKRWIMQQPHLKARTGEWFSLGFFPRDGK